MLLQKLCAPKHVTRMWGEHNETVWRENKEAPFMIHIDLLLLKGPFDDQVPSVV